MSGRLQLRRGTLAGLNSAALANNLLIGEPVFLTDSQRLGVAVGTSAYKLFQNAGEPWAINSGFGQFTNTEFGLPTVGTRSPGTRIVLYPSLSSEFTDFAIGLNGDNTMWFGVGALAGTNNFRWYGATTEMARLTESGFTLLNSPLATANNKQVATTEWIWQRRADVYPVRSGLNLTIAETQSAFTTQALGANNLRAFPWRVKRALTLTAMRCEVTTAIGGSTFRLGLYADNGAAFPGALLPVTAAQMDGAATGMKLATFASAVTIQPGLYWLAVHGSANTTLRSVPVASLANTLGASPTAANGPYTNWLLSTPYAALPATFPATAALSTAIGAPAAMFQTQ